MGNKLYISYRNDLFEEFELSARSRLLSVILLNFFRGEYSYCSKSELNSLLRLKKDKRYQTLYKCLKELESAEVIKILEDKPHHIKTTFIAPVDTKKGLKNPYIQVPINILFDCENISMDEILVLMSLFYKRSGVEKYMSLNELSDICKLSRQKISDAINTLREKGLVKRPKQKGTRDPFILGEVVGRKVMFFYQTYKEEKTIKKEPIKIIKGSKILFKLPK